MVKRSPNSNKVSSWSQRWQVAQSFHLAIISATRAICTTHAQRIKSTEGNPLQLKIANVLSLQAHLGIDKRKTELERT